MNSGGVLQTHDLPSSIQNHCLMAKLEVRAMAASAGYGTPAARETNGHHRFSATAVADASEPAILPLTEVERRAILQALDYTRGDRAVAAHLLGIGRTTLYRKLKEYNLPL